MYSLLKFMSGMEILLLQQNNYFAQISAFIVTIFLVAYFHFIHAFGNGRRSYASEPIAKHTVRSATDTMWTSRKHVMQSCRIAYSV